MPNFAGVMAMPRFASSCCALNAATAARRASNALVVFSSRQILSMRPASSTVWS
jgi:hypothetical protein